MGPIALTVWICLVFAQQSWGETSLELYIEPPKIEVGNDATLAIVISNAEPGATIQRPVLTGIDANLRHSFLTSSPRTNNVGGKTVQSVIVLFKISGDKVGEYKIPPQSVVIDGLTYRSSEGTLTVVGKDDTKPDRLPMLRLHLEKTRIYANELVPITAELLIHRETDLTRDPQIVPKRGKVLIDTFPGVPKSDKSKEFEGYIYRNFTTALRALQPGNYTVGPVYSDPVIEFPVESGSGRGSLLRNKEPRRIELESNTVELEVLPLPDGAPEGFRNSVGNYVMSAKVSQDELAVGDPISVEVQITGTGNIEDLTMPELVDVDGWKPYGPTRHKQEMATGLDPVTTYFTQVFVPERVHEEIPPFRFVFFDPDLAIYRTLETDPIPIDISPGIDPTELLTGSTNPNASPALLNEDIVTPIGRPSAEGVTLGSVPQALYQRRAFWLIQLIPLAALLFFLGIHFGRWWKSRIPREKVRSSRQLLKELESSNLRARQFYRLAGMIVDKWMVRQGSSAQLSPELTWIVERQHALCYTAPGDGGEIPVPPPERDRVIGALRELKL